MSRPADDTKRKQILELLYDPEWARASDREIAREVGCDHKTVRVVREVAAQIEPPGVIPQLGNNSALLFEEGDDKLGKVGRAINQAWQADRISRSQYECLAAERDRLTKLLSDEPQRLVTGHSAAHVVAVNLETNLRHMEMGHKSARREVSA